MVHDVHSLYSHHRAWLARWLTGRLDDPGAASDLVQDTFLRLLGVDARQLERLNEPRAYLVTVARHLLIDHQRRRALERALLEALAACPASSVPSSEERMIMLETLLEIERLLDGLAPKVRSAFLMARLEGLDQAEIARRLGVSTRSVRRYLIEALSHCLQASG
ncbi:sigma-70 family RNA polymerase sigma factor [Halotalea alkalilenta]|uniref:sigma-70 family RNA polymerase sigma factor n=1 Tax=Halotalea alkalilenta TaxID=376489 RepID=UPI00047FECC7|nr:sigma-70 family RNA polymerase sigma factor [Halotalea alkalilenta]